MADPVVLSPVNGSNPEVSEELGATGFHDAGGRLQAITPTEGLSAGNVSLTQGR